jgi:hypothetical protein
VITLWRIRENKGLAAVMTEKFKRFLLKIWENLELFLVNNFGRNYL